MIILKSYKKITHFIINLDIRDKKIEISKKMHDNIK